MTYLATWCDHQAIFIWSENKIGLFKAKALQIELI